ncbi:hypothetical protein [Sphingomonas baiyangensis]|uniref:C-type lysozyme inhibitor domain-containing protein n=1 Tax=Sphingomonas baiyangensis TaxID=2572576 RepID=A0A4U1KZR3_9SPHN|nr:hypothetical protein [Sphingomonas baiyangensis]TKD49921.1 hypothetical protein FBR43_03425 [Sphingomonas baiyangensis]
MKRTLLLAAICGSALSLAACQSEPEVIDTRPPNPLEAELANAAPVELPPAIRANVTFRCRDNSLAYVEFFQGDKQVTVRTDREGERTVLRASEAGQPFTAEGYSLSGDTENVTLKLPAKDELTCRAGPA